jgi:SNF2-related domain/Helicase conserved C-terminal domain
MPTFSAHLQNGRILVQAPVGVSREAYDDRASRIDGRRKYGRGWSFPATIRVARQIRVQFPDLKMSEALWSWGKRERQREASMNGLASKLEAPVPFLRSRLPRFHDGLRGDQRAAIAWLDQATLDGGVILGDKAGLGKTREAIGWVFGREVDPEGDHLIIAPRLALRATWERELRLLEDDLGDEVGIYLPGAYSSGAKRDKEMARWGSATEPYRFILIIDDMLAYWEDDDGRHAAYPELFEFAWNTVTIDESHKMLGALTVTKGPRYARGLLELDVPPNGRLLMSGTPFGKGGRARGMFGSFHWARPEEFTSFWRWADRVLEVDEEEFYIPRGGGRKGTKRVIGGLNEASWPAWSRDLDTLMLRRTKEEVGLNLPPILRYDVEVGLNGTQERAYRKLEKDAAAAIEGGQVLPANVLVELLRLKQFACSSWALYGEELRAILPSAKLEAVWEELLARGIDEDWELGGEKVVIGSQFVSFLELMAAEFGRRKVPCYLITGSPTEEHDAMVEEFQKEGGKPVLLMTIQKGTSIDLDRADTVIGTDLLWNPDDWDQFVDRCQRSRPTPLTAIRIVAADTVDAYIIETNADKEDIQHRVLDGRRGIEFAKQIIQRRKR